MSDLPSKGFKDKNVLAALIRNEGKIAATARDLGVSSQTVSNRLRRNPRLKEAYDTYLDEIVDDAVDALKREIREGNTQLIQFALDRLGRHRGFEKQTVQHQVSVEGNPDKPITIEKNINLDGLSLTEKMTLMKAARRKLEEDAGNGRPMEDIDDVIDAEVVEDAD